MIGLLDPNIIHHGGTDMFSMLFGFLGLVLFASVLVAALLVGKKAAQLLHVRGDTEVLKAKLVQKDLQHRLAVESHQHDLQLLALTAAPKQKEERDEVVTPKKKDITDPVVPRTEQWEHEKMQRTAEDAEVTPIPFTV